MTEQTIEIVKKRLDEIKSGLPLSISRIPENTLREFKELANREFCGDYGMCLNFIWEKVKEANTIYPVLLEHERRINSLEQSSPKGKEIRTLDGKIHRIGGRENGKI